MANKRVTFSLTLKIVLIFPENGPNINLFILTEKLHNVKINL